MDPRAIIQNKIERKNHVFFFHTCFIPDKQQPVLHL